MLVQLRRGISAVKVASGGIIYIPSLIRIGSRIRVILWVISEQFERLKCYHY
jgi:hypothetical protein